MTSFVLDLLIVAFFVLAVFLSAKKGLFKNIVSIGQMILSIVLAFLLGGKLSDFLDQKYIGPAVFEKIYEKVSGIAEKTMGDFQIEDILSIVPKFVLNDDLKDKLYTLQNTGDTYVTSISETIASPVSNAISNILGFIGVFLIVFVLVAILGFVLNKLIQHNKTLAGINRLLGGICGFLIAVLIATIVCGILGILFESSDFYANSVVAKFFGNTVFQNIF